MSEPPPSAPDRPTLVRWIVFALGCGTSWMLYLHRYAFGMMKPELERQFGWTTAELGVLDSTFFLYYAVFQVPGGLLADALGSRWFLGLSIILWSGAFALHASATSMTAMHWARGLFGTGQAAVYPILNRITRNWFPTATRTSAQGWIAAFSGRIGGASANLLFGTLLIGTLAFSWQQATYVFAAAGVVLGILFLWLFRETPRKHPWANTAEADLIEGPQAVPSGTATPPLTVRRLFSQISERSLWNVLALTIQTSLSTIADNIYVSWIPLFLSQVHHLKYSQLGLLSMLPLIGGAVGGTVGGLLNDWLIRRTGNPRFSRSAVGLTGKGMAAILLFLSLLTYDKPYEFCMMLVAVKFFSDWSLASTWGTVTDIGGRATATVFAFNNSIAGTTVIVAPILFGYSAQTYGWKFSFVVVATVYALCAASWIFVDCTRPVLEADKS